MKYRPSKRRPQPLWCCCRHLPEPIPSCLSRQKRGCRKNACSVLQTSTIGGTWVLPESIPGPLDTRGFRRRIDRNSPPLVGAGSPQGPNGRTPGPGLPQQPVLQALAYGNKLLLDKTITNTMGTTSTSSTETRGHNLPRSRRNCRSWSFCDYHVILTHRQI